MHAGTGTEGAAAEDSAELEPLPLCEGGEWTRWIRGPLATDTAVDGDGNVYVFGHGDASDGIEVGAFRQEAVGTATWVAKLDPCGEPDWLTVLPDTYCRTGACLSVSEDGEVLLFGLADSLSDLDGFDLEDTGLLTDVVYRLDTNGKVFDARTPLQIDAAAVASDGNFWISGRGFEGYEDDVLVAFDREGAARWTMPTPVGDSHIRPLGSDLLVVHWGLGALGKVDCEYEACLHVARFDRKGDTVFHEVFPTNTSAVDLVTDTNAAGDFAIGFRLGHDWELELPDGTVTAEHGEVFAFAVVSFKRDGTFRWQHEFRPSRGQQLYSMRAVTIDDEAGVTFSAIPDGDTVPTLYHFGPNGELAPSDDQTEAAVVALDRGRGVDLRAGIAERDVWLTGEPCPYDTVCSFVTAMATE